MTTLLKNYEFFNCGNIKRIFGTAFLTRKNVIDRIIEFKSISERIS